MRFESRFAFASARQVPRVCAPEDLPVELAFLERFGVARAVLARAAARARREGIACHRALIVEGAVGETFYYLALALQLGLPFVDGWPCLAQTPDPRAALKGGRVRLACGPAWLIAPGERQIRTLLRARALGLGMPDAAIAAPAHFEALVCHRMKVRIAGRASLALPIVAPRLSARRPLAPVAVVAVAAGLLGLFGGVAFGSHLESGALGLLFLVALVFRLVVFAAGLSPAEACDDGQLADRELPTYSILVPLRDEAGMIADLVGSLAALDYPSGKREVLFLIEPDDPSTRAALVAARLPVGFRIVDLPPGLPRTKPRALNVGLLVARGDLVTVYDAEDRPEPDQLRRAAARFAAAPAQLACVQARLAIANGSSGLLARLFAIEYAALFEIFNLGLARFGLPIALGGTSNHFRADVLRAVGGWDAWNVTEDADLGLRLARFGLGVGILASTTWEEAPERLDTWFKQRRRWTKGWVQTLVVLLRDASSAATDLGPRKALAVALLLTNLVTGPLLTPFFLVLVSWHLASGGLPRPHGAAETLEATLAFSVIAIGAVGTLWSGWLGVRRRSFSAWRSLPAFLPYQLMIAMAAWSGIWDLVVRPHHWHKTQHGAAGRRRDWHPPFVVSNVWQVLRLCAHRKGGSDESNQDHDRRVGLGPVHGLGFRAERRRQGHWLGWDRRPGQPEHGRQQRWLGPLSLAPPATSFLPGILARVRTIV